MKLLILGATGPTGQKLVTNALEKGHEVTAFVRTPSKLTISNPRLKIVQGDALQPETLKQALIGQDAVISALGVGNSLKPNQLIEKAVGNLVPAMQTANVKRLIFLSAFGVGPTFTQSGLIQRFAFSVPLKNIYKDKVIGERLIENSALNWTLVCPVMMTHGAFTGNYRAAEHFNMTGMPTVSRADVADFMVSQAGSNEFLFKHAIVKGPA